MNGVDGPMPEADAPVGRQQVFEVFGDSLINPDSLYYPDSPVEPDDIAQRFEILKKINATIVLVDGAFDVPQPNHDWYLRHARLLGSKLSLEKTGMPVNTDNLARVVGGEDVALVVTVDADAKVQAKKSGVAEKGGAPRPVYPWQLRAERVAGLTFRLNGVLRNVVDMVTVEGDPGHSDSPLESTLALAEFLSERELLDGLVVYGEHQETVVKSFSSGVKTLVIPNKTNYSVNPLSGEPWSSSAFIERVRGPVQANL